VNVFVIDVAIVGRSNTILHSLAIANERGIKLALKMIDKISKMNPNIYKCSPSSAYHMEDVDTVGGISAIIKEMSKIKSLLKTKAITVSEKTIGNMTEPSCLTEK
jgi:dihydroxy-acid dehydratase